jgi:hypothetical protein
MAPTGVMLGRFFVVTGRVFMVLRCFLSVNCTRRQAALDVFAQPGRARGLEDRVPRSAVGE